jgi:hypothetical protein
MKASTRTSVLSFTTIAAILLSLPAAATTQLLLSRDSRQPVDNYQGVVELVVSPGFDNAIVAIALDGQKLIEGLHSPYHVTVDLGDKAIEHKIAVNASSADKAKRTQWSVTINRGLLPLTVQVKPADLPNRVFEVETTSPKDDPIAAVDLWFGGRSIATATEAPYRFTIPVEAFASQFVQVTARTKSGEEAADFWSASGDVHVEELAAR